jgi:hypothetical protein
MSSAGFFAVVALASLKGALVALPRGDALAHLGRLRSPVWAVVLPGSIVVGTFGVLALPSMALGLVVLAGLATPLLIAVAVVAVLRGPRAALLLAALGLAAVAVLRGGWIGQLSASVLTALGCLTLGVALVRLVPGRWVLVGVLCMCAVDVVLLALGVGQQAAALMADAAEHVRGPAFDRAAIGKFSTDYPDLVLAAVLGGFLAGQGVQRRAAVLVAALGAGYGLLLHEIHTLPGTVPIALIFVLVRWAPLPPAWRAEAMAPTANMQHAMS